MTTMSAPDLSIRRAHAADVERMVVIWQEVSELLTNADRRWKLAAQGSEAWAAAVQEWLTREDMLVVVAERKGTVIGYAVGQVAANAAGFEPAQIGLINDFAIDPHGRGDGGIGTQLVGAIRAWLRERGITYLQARVPTSQPIAQTFWRASGASVLFDTMWMKIE
ncbi:MAG: GNAT family N-acetyltransferase [Anaerolineae bacterium]|nr:GNAT family N-acetyltransferase [Anaerolineae bacterium]